MINYSAGKDNGAVTVQYLSAEVHQAEGALSARLGISIREAVEALRAMAHRSGRPLPDVARQVLAERRPDR